MKKKTLNKVRIVIWILGFIAVGLLLYGIIKTLI